MLRQFLGRQLEAAFHLRQAPRQMAEAVALPPRDELPKSLLVRFLAADHSSIVETMVTESDALRTLVGQPRGRR